MGVKNRCEASLRKISLGKYQTTLYNKNGSAFHSSAIGGLITIFAVSIIGAAILIQLIAVFNKSHYNLDIEGELIQAYLLDDNYMLHENMTSCSDYVPIKIRDFPKIIGNSKIILINPSSSVNDTLNCTNINVEVVVRMFEGNFTAFNVPLKDAKFGCILLLKSIPLSDHLSTKEMDQLLFYKPKINPEIYTRI